MSDRDVERCLEEGVKKILEALIRCQDLGNDEAGPQNRLDGRVDVLLTLPEMPPCVARCRVALEVTDIRELEEPGHEQAESPEKARRSNAGPEHTTHKE